MRKYIIKKVNKDNKIDWASVPQLEVSKVMWLPSYDISMSQQLCYDERNIYIHQSATEKSIRAEETEPLSQICNDSCMEFFIDFMGDGRYFNFEINPIGNLYLGFGKMRGERFRMIDKEYKRRFDIKTELTSDGWEVYYAIPLEFVQDFYPNYSFVSGAVVRANCYKCGDKTVNPHYLAWNPPTSETPDFHRPMDFGEMVFE